MLQTSIVTDGFRSLAEGEAVEFTIEHGDDGRTKAVQVTGPAGAPPQVRLGSCSPAAVDLLGSGVMPLLWRKCIVGNTFHNHYSSSGSKQLDQCTA